MLKTEAIFRRWWWSERVAEFVGVERAAWTGTTLPLQQARRAPVHGLCAGQAAQGGEGDGTRTQRPPLNSFGAAMPLAMPRRGCCVTLRFVSLNLDAFLLAGGRG
jgi:hypothetical protein